jgi:amino acid transporter
MLWNTSGFDNAGTCASEVANPGTTYPKALAVAVILVMLTYAVRVFLASDDAPDGTAPIARHLKLHVIGYFLSDAEKFFVTRQNIR